MMLRNHGLMTCAASVADAFLMMFIFQRTCEIQLMAQGSGAALSEIPKSILAGTQAMLAGVLRSSTGMGGALPWPALLRKLDEQMPGYAS